MVKFTEEAQDFIANDTFFEDHFNQSFNSLEEKAEEYEEYKTVAEFNRIRGRNYDSIEEIKEILDSDRPGDEALVYVTGAQTIVTYTYI